MGMLCQELTAEAAQSYIRKSAGLIIKNSLTAKDFEKQEELSVRWISIDANIREQIKAAVRFYNPDPRYAWLQRCKLWDCCWTGFCGLNRSLLR